MKRFRLIFVGMISGIILTFGFLWIGSLRSAMAQPGQAFVEPTPAMPLQDEGNTGQALQVGDVGDEQQPPAELSAPGLGPLFVLPTQIPGETTVYFVPSDNDATGTVLYLYNTDGVDHVVALRGFNYDGAMVYAQNITIPASSFRRLISDLVAAAPPPSWATPAPITTNFTDFVYFASISLARGVKVEGYEVFNPGTGVINPRLDQGAIPLRFSTDPATVFLPAIQAP